MSKVFIAALPIELEFQETIVGIPVKYSGVGKLNSAITTMELINQGVKEIINIGSCGSKKHILGEILKIGRVYQDIDGSPISSYGETPMEENSKFIVLEEGNNNTCFTTDYFFDHNQLSKYSENYMNMISESSVFDMELFGIAKACKLKGVKLSSYKWVSDDGNYDSWLENCKLSFNKFINLYQSL